MDSSSSDQHFSHRIASEDKFAVCHEDSKIPSSFVLIDLHLLTQYMTPPPTWPPPRQRKLIIKGENPNKSANIDNRSYVKEPFVSSVSCRYTGSTVQGFSWGLRLLVIGWHDVTNYSNYVFSQSCFFHLFFLTNYDFLRFQKSSFKLTNVAKLNYHTHMIITIHMFSKISSHGGPTDSLLSAYTDPQPIYFHLSVRALCKLFFKKVL